MTAARRALALLALMRPANAIVTALSVAVGALTSGAPLEAGRVGLAALSALLVAGAGNALNDALDVETDRVNRPQRPLPAGRLTRRAAVWWAALLAAAGCGLGAVLSPGHLALALAVAGLVALYNTRLKSTVLWGNAAVGLAAACAFPYGALAVGGLGRAWIPAAFAFLFHVGREIVKDIEDQPGDGASGVATLPLRCGARCAATVASVVFAALVALTVWPWLAGTYAGTYLALVAGVDAVVLYVLVRLHTDLQRLPGDLLGRLLKADMLLGLLAVVAGELHL